MQRLRLSCGEHAYSNLPAHTAHQRGPRAQSESELLLVLDDLCFRFLFFFFLSFFLCSFRFFLFFLRRRSEEESESESELSESDEVVS